MCYRSNVVVDVVVTLVCMDRLSRLDHAAGSFDLFSCS